MTQHALAILDAAVKEAESGPIEPTPAIRLALSWITVQGLTEPWQVDEFWHWLRHPVEDPTQPQAEYCRQRDLRLPVEAWRRIAQERERR